MTIDGLSWLPLLACLAIVFAGTTVQASIGIGLGMMSSPVLALVDTDFLPVAILLSVIPLSGTVAWAEREHIDRRGTLLMLAGRIPGVVGGVFIVTQISDAILGLFVASAVIIAVVVSVVGRKFVAGSRSLVVAGGLSGLMATATGVGGPPIALTYQHETPETMRSTISAFFTVGAVMSLVGLLIAGEITRRSLELTGLLAPAVIVGLLTARRYRSKLDPATVRPAVLVLCTSSALALLVRTLF